MCRVLYVRSDKLFPPGRYLKPFAKIAKNSKEYQGHGWGCAFLERGDWRIYKDLTPIWKDDLTQFGETTELLVHARSAFQDKGIELDNNMPFFDGQFLFAFNGELRGVRIKEQGRIGAEKVFRVIQKQHLTICSRPCSRESPLLNPEQNMFER